MDCRPKREINEVTIIEIKQIKKKKEKTQGANKKPR